MKSPLQAMRDLLADDTRYKLEAYQFIREALQYAHEHMVAGDTRKSESLDDLDFSDEEDSRHVTGQQLCEACRLYALDQYGYLARMVLGSWGIQSTSDLGELVYNLIRIEQMRKSESDRREDFDDVYEFETAFAPEFEYTINSDD
ncbi:Minf_1886 family protein [Rubripirellula amarantea]